MMKEHALKVWNGSGWVAFDSLSYDERVEAHRKGLVEHDEWCWCVSVTDEPPF